MLTDILSATNVCGHIGHALQKLGGDHSGDQSHSRQAQAQAHHYPGKDQQRNFSKTIHELPGKEQNGYLAQRGNAAQHADQAAAKAKLHGIAAHEGAAEAQTQGLDQGQSQHKKNLRGIEYTLPGRDSLFPGRGSLLTGQGSLPPSRGSLLTGAALGQKHHRAGKEQVSHGGHGELGPVEFLQKHACAEDHRRVAQCPADANPGKGKTVSIGPVNDQCVAQRQQGQAEQGDDQHCQQADRKARPQIIQQIGPGRAQGKQDQQQLALAGAVTEHGP